MPLETPIVAYLLARTDGDPPLTAGVSALVGGQPARAAVLFEEIVADADDPVRQVRAAAYHRLATHLRWNAFPGGGGAGATEVAARWEAGPSPVERRADWAARARDLDDPAVRDEVRTVGGVLCALRSARLIVDYAAARLEPPDVARQLEDAVAVLVPPREAGEPALRAYADLAAADLARRARRPEQAAASLRDAAAGYGAAGDAVGLAACHLARGDWRAAPATSPVTRNLTMMASATESSALEWALEAREGDLAGLDADRAAAAYADAEAAFRDAGSVRGVAAVALRRSYLAGMAGDQARAVQEAAQAATTFEACGDGWGTWLARVHEALAGVAAGRLAAGTAAVEEAGAWGRGSGSFSYALGLGLLCSRSGRRWLQHHADAERALAAHRLARALFAALGAVTDEVQSIVDAGRVRQVLGDAEGAQASYEEALDLLTTDLDARPVVAEDNRLRAVTLAQNLYAMQLAKRDPDGMGRAAERLRAQAARLPEAGGDDRVEGMLLAATAGILAQARVLVPLYRAEEARESGEDEAVEAGLGTALAAARDPDTPDGDFLEALVLAHWRRDAEAAGAFQRYIDRVSAPPTGLLGRVLTRIGPLKGERELAEQRIHEQAGAFFRRVRDFPAAIRHFTALERSAGPRWWTRLERPWELLSDHGAACEGVGDLTRALELHGLAVAELESRRERLRRDELKTALSGTSGAAAVYLAAARTALRMSEAAAAAGREAQAAELGARAFVSAERGRARGLLDLLRAGAALARAAPGERAAVRAWHQANAELALLHGLLATEQSSALPDPDRLAALRERAAAAEEDVARREADLESADPAFAQAVAVPEAVAGLDDVRAALPAGVALLAYHHVDEDLLAWAVTGEGLAATSHGTVRAADLARDVRGFTRACVEGGAWERRGAGLAHMLLDPFAGVLAATDRVIVVPATATHAMPFHALPWHGRPLAATHAVSYLPSASSLRFLPTPEGGPADRALCVGDPAGAAWQELPGQAAGPAKPLPAAAVEAAFVAALFPDARLLVGGAATEPAVREVIGSYPVVHLAAHGQLSDEAPLLTCVLLADGQALSVYELMGLRLDADLVVLSACDSGRGRATAGGDVHGMTRGLLAAGARGVVVSLWPVPDRSTCVLMAQFHRRLRAGVPAPVALKRAQAHVRGLDRDGEAAEFRRIAAAVEDPAAARDVLAPLAGDEDDGVAGPGGTGGAQRERAPYWWAGFTYVGR
ncbi:MAG TPA: CHAT domain-containing protein [Egibacteraceae bacterium]|nr:CHAT domain-containing protein [Egibacteraceae bacterium]